MFEDASWSILEVNEGEGLKGQWPFGHYSSQEIRQREEKWGFVWQKKMPNRKYIKENSK